MISTGRLDLRADRWVGCYRTFNFAGADFTGALFYSQIRLTKDAKGAPLIDLTNAAAGAQGIHFVRVVTDTVANHIANGLIPDVPPGYEETDVIPVSEVSFTIAEDAMALLPYPPELGDDNVLAWDLQILPVGGIKDKYLGGDFIVLAGATE